MLVWLGHLCVGDGKNICTGNGKNICTGHGKNICSADGKVICVLLVVKIYVCWCVNDIYVLVMVRISVLVMV